MHRRGFLRLSSFLVGVLLLICITSVTPLVSADGPSTCPLAINLKTKNSRQTQRKGLQAGDVIKIATRVVNQDKKIYLNNVAVKIALPIDGSLVLLATHVTPRLTKKTAVTLNTTISPLVEGTNIYWTNIPLGPGKSRVFSLKARVKNCPKQQAGGYTIEIGGLAYLTADDNGAYCPTEATPPVELSINADVDGHGQKKKHLYDNCTTPTAAPASAPSPTPDIPGVEVYADNQRCLEAILTPLRLLQQGEIEPQEPMNGEDVARALSPTTNPTAQECYNYCLNTLGYSVPFYVNLQQLANHANCYCCNRCTLFYDPNSTVFKVNQIFTGPPTTAPSVAPSSMPSVQPTSSPTTFSPTNSPSLTPSQQPSSSPSLQPSQQPTTSQPSSSPSLQPSSTPSTSPSSTPSNAPTSLPSTSPSMSPSASPSHSPSAMPSASPSASPSSTPSIAPTSLPSAAPSQSPSATPSQSPSQSPSSSPSSTPSQQPSSSPSLLPSSTPSTTPSQSPSSSPSSSPSQQPSSSPSLLPSSTPSTTPSQSPSIAPTTASPSSSPSQSPSISPTTAFPSHVPSQAPTTSPTIASTGLAGSSTPFGLYDPILPMTFAITAQGIYPSRNRRGRDLAAAEDYMGLINIFAFNFVPKDFLSCNGQLLPLSQNTALFSLLGTTYGGNGVTTFGLPDLQNRYAVGSGQSPGLSIYDLGQTGGAASYTLTTANLPVHTHGINGTQTTNPTGSGTTFGILSPFQTLSYVICVDGLYPSRSRRELSRGRKLSAGTAFLGEIRVTATNFEPNGYLYCDGRILSIADYSALFSLLGTTYIGGDGTTTFALPDLRGRVPLSAGNSVSQGETAGQESVTLGINSMPPHLHSVVGGSTDMKGGGADMANKKPYLGILYVIAAQGIFPSQNRRRDLWQAGSWNESTASQPGDEEGDEDQTHNRRLIATETFLGSIMSVAFDFAPQGWLKCDGSLLSISSNQALFSLLGTMYGGNGQTTFAVPDLRDRKVLGKGSTYGIGTQAGSNVVDLSLANLPTHLHTYGS